MKIPIRNFINRLVGHTKMENVDQTAIRNNDAELCEALKGSVRLFLSDLQLEHIINSEERQIIESLTLDQDKIMRTLEILKEKDTGLPFILKYLRNNGMSKLADNLSRARVTTKLENFKVSSNITTVILEKFIAEVIEFYSGNFRAVEGLNGNTEPIESAWINLQLERDSHSSKNYDDIFVAMAKENCRAALVKGQPDDSRQKNRLRLGQTQTK